MAFNGKMSGGLQTFKLNCIPSCTRTCIDSFNRCQKYSSRKSSQLFVPAGETKFGPPYIFYLNLRIYLKAIYMLHNEEDILQKNDTDFCVVSLKVCESSHTDPLEPSRGWIRTQDPSISSPLR